MMATDEGNPAPHPSPPVARLPRLPTSNAEIIRPRNADVCLLLLWAVLG